MDQIKRALRRLSYYSTPLLALSLFFLLLLILFFSIGEKKEFSKIETPPKDEEISAKVPPLKEPLPEPPPEEQGSTPPPYVAIILDDLGWNYTIARSLLEMETPISFAILPNLEYSVKIAEEAHALNRDVLLHLPMGSQSHFKKYPPLAPLTIDMPPESIKKNVEAYLDAVPYIRGVNNHMGSSFTENEEGMERVLSILRERGLFFVDSLTTPKSVAHRLAKRAGIRTARRSVFLDNDDRPEEIEKRFAELKRIALRRGAAIGIGHPRKNTILVLRKMVVKLTEAGIRIVPVSQLVR